MLVEMIVRNLYLMIFIQIPAVQTQPSLVSASPARSITLIDLTRSLILAVSVCYHARLTDRTDYEERVSKEFIAPLALTEGPKEFRNVIRWYVLHQIIV